MKGSKSGNRLQLIIVAIIFVGVGIIACTKKVESKVNFIYKTAPKTGVAMKISGEEITEQDLMKGMESDIFEAEMKVYEIKMNALKAKVLEKLMEKHPDKKNLSNDEFLEKIISKGKEASKSDIDKFISERKIPAEHINDEMRDRIKKFLDIEVKKQAVDDWIVAQTQKNPVEIYLTKPTRPVFEVKIDNAPFVGKSDAKVTLVEFSDFQCPFCAKGHDILNDIKKKYGDKVKIVFKNFPLPFHNNARTAAEAGLCANEQGVTNFWKMHDMMFEDQTKLAKEDLIATAKKIGMVEAKFSECLNSGRYGKAIDEDMEHGKDVGVKSTPTFFVNGKMVNGAQPLDIFTELIDSDLAL